MERENIIEKFGEFLREEYYNGLVTAVNEGKKSVYIDFSLLDIFDPELADYLLENPEEVLELAEEAVKQIDLPGEAKLRIRIFNLPESREIRIRNIRAEHIGKLIAVDGIVKRASEIRPEVSEVVFSCPECGRELTVIQTERIIQAPVECECGNRKNFKLLKNKQKLYDARWIAVEEPFEIVSGERPSEIMVFLKEDLTSPKMQNKTDPGNRIKIVGILKELPRRVKGTRSRQVEIYIEANSVESIEVEWEELEITPEDEKRILELARDPEIYDKLVRSIGPSLYGLEEVKEAIVLQLFGGEPHVQKDKSRVRGDIHILLVGDPSCLVGDERVVLGNGSIVKISSLGKEHLQKINIPVYLAEGYKRGIAKIFHKYEFQPIIEIVTESGKSIKGTFNQPVLVKKKTGKFGKFTSEWKRLDEIKIGDEVRVINWIPCSIHKYVETGWCLKDSPKRKNLKVPKVLDEKLASILGYLLADGYVQKYRVGCTFNYEELDLLPKIESFFEEVFGIKPRFDYRKEKNGIVEMVFNSVELSEVLQFLKKKRIPDMVLLSKNSVVAAFLSWLYDGDGSVISGGRGKNGILYKAKDIELLRDIQILLLRFGIHSRIYGNNLMIRQASSIIKFANSIGFNSQKKKEKLQKLVKNVKKLKRKRHNKRWEKIVKIIYHPPETVYDIEVPLYYKFVANGIVCHNTAKSALMKVVSSLIPRGRYVSGKGVSIDYDDPLIYREDGLIKTDIIGRFCDKFYKHDEIGFVKVKGIEVPVFDSNTFKISWKPVTCIFRHTIKEPLLKLTLRTGREIRVTAGHSIYTLDNGEIVAKRADELKVGDFILIPSRIPPNDKIVKKIVVVDLIKNHPEIKLKTFKRFPKEVKVNSELMRLIGYYIAEGSLNKGKEHWKVRFDVGEKDKEIVEDIKCIVKRLFGLEVKEYKKKNAKGKVLEINSELLLLIFKEILQVGKSAQTKRIPSIVFNTTSKNQLEFLRAYLKGDYGVTTSKELMSDLQYLFLLNGIISSFLTKRIKGKIKFPDHVSFVDTIVYELKAPKVSKLLKGVFSISRIHGYPPLKCFNSEKILNLAKSGYKRVSRAAMKMLFSPYNRLLFSRLEMLRKGIDAKELSRICKINKKSASQYLNSLVKKDFAFKIGKKGEIKYFLTAKGKLLLKEIKLINSLLLSDLGFVEIKQIEKIKASKRFVYDLEVENFNNFVAGFGGVICHNTAAGLTATVVRDEEFLGGWVLEAGALVMCNRSLCAIDEFEKVEKTDQIALHEAMEQQSYHPNVEILLADGRKIKIGEFVDNLFNLLKDKSIKGINCEILPLQKINIPILTTDGQKLFVTKINQVSRHKATKKFVKITYSNGRKIIVTPEHPVFVFEDSITTKPAIEVKPGDFVPGPRDLPLITLSKNLELPSLRGRKKVIFPTEISADFGKFLGYFISEGYSYTGSSKEIGISNTSGSIISETQRITNTLFGITPLDYSKRNRTQRIISSSIFNFMLKNFPEIMQKAKNKRIPSNILTTEKEVLREFLKTAFEGDGSIESNAVCYRTASSKLAEDYQDALLRFGIFSRIAYDRHNNSYKVYITSDSLEKFTRAILKKKYKKIEKLIKSSKKKLRKHDVLPASIGLKIRNLMKKVGLTYTGYFNPHIRFNFGITREVFDKYVKQIRKKIEKSYKAIEEIEDFKELRKKLNYSQKYVANLLKVSRGKIDYIERGGYAKEIREKFLKLFKQSVKIKIKKVEESLNQLENLKSFRWLKVKKVEVLENKGSMKTEWVYDVTVEPTKCFISNGLILHNTISIAKANIVATLPARTSILAGGNPKLGRFDPYLPIKEQIDVPETILARFDLKFALRDIPNPELDSKIAEHILKARHYEEEEIKPEIDAEFIKKYVAYARKNCHPKLTKEAGEAIKDFFVKLREKVSGEEAPVPITLRQYEALIRLAEASAKIQLRNEVIKEDAIRAINLMKASLRQFGFDPEIGKIDIDRVEGHMTATQRSKVRVLLDVIEELTKTIGKNVPKEDIIKMAKSKGLKEFDIEKMLNELKNNGTLFEPRPGILQKM